MITADICVIGAGSGGLSVAAGAAQLGLSVVLIEAGEMGGDCLNTGCVPSKAMLCAAAQSLEWHAIMQHIRHAQAAIAPHDSQERFESLGVTVLRARARFRDAHTVETDAGHLLRARYIVIATGSVPRLPDIDGLDPARILTNETVFKQQERPGRLAIIGGGPIGVEMAQAHRDAGCAVTLLTRGRILARDEPELAAVVRSSLAERGVGIIEDAIIQSVTHHADGTHSLATGRKTLTADAVLVAAGRVPCFRTLNLDTAGIRHDSHGIQVNRRMQTSRRHIYAIGDVVAGGPQFTHAAGYQAGIVIRNICFRMPARADYASLPRVTYTSPELAQAGLTEAEAVAQFGREKIRALTLPLAANDRAATEGVTAGAVKIVGLRNGRILGAGIAAPHAGEMISLWTLAIGRRLSMGAVAGMIVPYPTLSETGKAAAGAWYKDRLFSPATRRIVRLLQRLPRW